MRGHGASAVLGWRSSTLTHLLKTPMTQRDGLLHMLAIVEPLPKYTPFNTVRSPPSPYLPSLFSQGTFVAVGFAACVP